MTKPEIQSAINVLDTAAASAIHDFERWPDVTWDHRLMLRVLRWLLKRYQYVLVCGARF